MATEVKLTVSASHSELLKNDREYWKKQTPESRLDAVEALRIEAGKFLYAYPARLRRIVTVARRQTG